jgi:hypothetical protein
VTVTGVVEVEGRPTGGVDVLAFEQRERPTLVATGATDDVGAFRLAAGDEPVALLAKVRTDQLLAVAAGEAPAGGGSVTLAASGPFHDVEATLDLPDGSLERLLVFVDPVALVGVPEALAPFAKQKAPGVFEGRYVQRGAPGGTLRLRLQRGLWRIGGGLQVDAGKSLEPPPSYVIEEARDESGAPLAGTPTRGFDLDMSTDRSITLFVRPKAAP